MDVSQTITVYNFSEEPQAEGWKIVNDGVMGGQSKSSFSRHADGYLEFKGEVSLANNGGFASLKNSALSVDVKHTDTVLLKLRGDGKTYQFRIKADSTTEHSYIYSFTTTGRWETVTIPFGDLNPSYRGKPLERPSFNFKKIEEAGFLIANKKAENFRLDIKSIVLIKQ